MKRDSPRRRWTAAGIAVALHLAILALFLRSHPPVHVGAGEGEGAMDVSLAGFSRGAAAPRAPASPAAQKLPAAPAPPSPADPIKPRTVLQMVSDILAIPVPENTATPTPPASAPSSIVAQAIVQASGASGAACDIGGAVQTVLRFDPEAYGAIILVPHQARMAANAVMMWNGQWIAPADAGGVAALDALRVAVRQVVASAQPDCRDRALVGPRFMLIPDGDTTMVVVFGNTLWRWSDLLGEPNPVQQAPPNLDEKRFVREEIK